MPREQKGGGGVWYCIGDNAALGSENALFVMRETFILRANFVLYVV